MNLQRYTSAGGVIIHDGKMLLLDRPKRGEVRLPKGHVEHDEAPEEAALREVAEEAGYPDLAIVADLGWKAVTFEYEGDRIVRDERYFLMHLTSRRQIRRSKKDEKQFQPIWVPMDEGPDELTYASEQSAARAALAVERGEGDIAERGERDTSHQSEQGTSPQSKQGLPRQDGGDAPHA